MCRISTIIMSLICMASFAQLPPTETAVSTEVSPENVLPEHPRPKMKRNVWQSLNGQWNYALQKQNQTPPEEWEGKIVVPFPVQSPLSGLGYKIAPDTVIWYQREFEAPTLRPNGHLLLHFTGVVGDTQVWVNGIKIGEQVNSYEPLSFDITSALKTDEAQEILVAVAPSPSTDNESITPPIKGIWQTVWLEPVPENYIQSVKVVPDIEEGEFHIQISGTGSEDTLFRAAIRDGSRIAGVATGFAYKDELVIHIYEAKQWSPESPFLYGLEISLIDDQRTVADKIYSYTAMREIEAITDEEGDIKLLLNGEKSYTKESTGAVWWLEGYTTPPTDESLRKSIEERHEAGVNLHWIYNHPQPSRFFMHCDQVGILVWPVDIDQDSTQTP